MAKENFYIGYLPNAPKPLKRFLSRFVWLTVPILLVFAVSLVLYQKDYVTSTFEIGQSSTITGILTYEPVPMLKVSLGKNDQGKEEYQSVLLIDFGKKGAEESLRKIEATQGALEGKSLTLEGTLIYYDGKSLLEMTKSENAFVKVEEGNLASQTNVIGKVNLTGEIADPKCYFGVMKPGEGKPHRSCAARCIAGGIPPVFKVEQNGTVDYYLVKGTGGKAIYEELFPIIAEQISLEGQAYQVDDWKVIEIDNLNEIKRLSQGGLPNPPMCSF